MNNEFDFEGATERYELLMQKLGLKSSFTIDELIDCIERSRNGRRINIGEGQLSPDIYGCARLADDGESYLIGYNDKLQRRIALRAILHELGHIARGDVDRKYLVNARTGQSTETVCYQRRIHFYDAVEKEVEFICSNWLDRLISIKDGKLDEAWLNKE